MTRTSAWFGTKGITDADLRLELSRYRFVYASVPAHAETWAAIQKEYAQIMTAREAVS